MRIVPLLLLTGALTLTAGCESASENAGSTAGPNVDARCLRKQGFKLLPGQGSATGVGDTNVEVFCSPP